MSGWTVCRKDFGRRQEYDSGQRASGGAERQPERFSPVRGLRRSDPGQTAQQAGGILQRWQAADARLPREGAMKTQIVLFGAGETGRMALEHLRSRGIAPVAFADGNARRWRERVDGVPVMNPEAAHRAYPDAHWVATVFSFPASQEVPELMRRMGVSTLPLWSVLPVANGYPKPDISYGASSSPQGFASLMPLLADGLSRQAAQDQFDFYRAPDYDVPASMEPPGE